LVERPELAGIDAGRIDAPAGVALGAEGPEEVATAVAARLVADLRAAAAPVWAVIPAAGAGLRMGGGKLRLAKEGTSLLGRALRTAEASCDGTLVVLGHDADGLRSELDASAGWVIAERWRDGLAASLRAGLAALPAGARAIVLLPDMPGVDAGHVAALRSAARSTAARTIAGAVSRYPGGAWGAPALLPVDLVGALRAESPPIAGDRGLAPWLTGRADLAEVPLADAGDVDTPEAARAAGWSRGPVRSGRVGRTGRGPGEA
jgi:CTP:molybdopterin cytidylyltransferase MocA